MQTIDCFVCRTLQIKNQGYLLAPESVVQSSGRPIIGIAQDRYSLHTLQPAHHLSSSLKEVKMVFVMCGISDGVPKLHPIAEQSRSPYCCTR